MIKGLNSQINTHSHNQHQNSLFCSLHVCVCMFITIILQISSVQPNSIYFSEIKTKTKICIIFFGPEQDLVCMYVWIHVHGHTDKGHTCDLLFLFNLWLIFSILVLFHMKVTCWSTIRRKPQSRHISHNKLDCRLKATYTATILNLHIINKQ